MPSLWSPTDWPQRLAELQAPTGELKKAPLRRDVRSLGVLLGEALREQAGESLYQAVEDLRRTAIARRDADATAHDVPNSTDALAALAEQHLQHALTRVQSLTSDTAYQLARAFVFFFELTNLAETNYRKRRRQSSRSLYAAPTTNTRAAPLAAACGRISITTSCSSAVAKCISRSTENPSSLYPFSAETFG